MIKKIFLISLLFLHSAFMSNALAAGGSVQLIDKEWHFEGYAGTVDRASAQRGFQVYKEVCSSCHGLKHISYRNLRDLGFSEAEVKTIAADDTIIDGPNDDGDMFERNGRPSDKIQQPYDNEKAARASNGGAYPPNLSLIIKSRPNGADYLYSLLNGYVDAPEGFKLGSGMNYNEYFPGHQIAMAAPLSDEQVEYMDGTESSVEQMSIDVTNFLQWAAEPEMEHRKRMGIKVFIYLILFTILFYFAKNRIWARVK